MTGEKGELWRKLCEQAAVEQDPDKLLELTREINCLLDEKEDRLQAVSSEPTDGFLANSRHKCSRLRIGIQSPLHYDASRTRPHESTFHADPV